MAYTKKVTFIEHYHGSCRLSACMPSRPMQRFLWTIFISDSGRFPGYGMFLLFM